jgi:hypothetical protein
MGLGQVPWRWKVQRCAKLSLSTGGGCGWQTRGQRRSGGVDGVCWWNPRPREKKNQKVRLPDLGSFARGVRVDGGAPVLPRIPQYAADPVDYLFCGGDWRSGTPITMFGVSIRDPGLEAKIIM